MRLTIIFLFQNKLLVSCPLCQRRSSLVFSCYLWQQFFVLSLSLSFFFSYVTSRNKNIKLLHFSLIFNLIIKSYFFGAISFFSKVWLCLTFLHFILIDIFQFFLFSSPFLVCVLGLLG